MNVCSGETYSFIDLADKIHKIGGRNTGNMIISPGMGAEYSGDNEKLLNWLNVFDKSTNEKIKFTPIDQSLQELYKWYFDRKDEIDPSLL
jgi:GDP-L-fucose synthase